MDRDDPRLIEAWRQLEDDGSNLDFEAFLSIRVNRLALAINKSSARPYLSDVGLDTQEWRTIALVGSVERRTAKELSARCSIDKAVFSRTLKRLKDRGVVHVEIDPLDGRRQLLSLTREGRKLYDAVLPRAQARQASFLQAISSSDRVRFWKILDDLIQTVESVNEAEASAMRLA